LEKTVKEEEYQLLMKNQLSKPNVWPSGTVVRNVDGGVQGKTPIDYDGAPRLAAVFALQFMQIPAFNKCHVSRRIRSYTKKIAR
jgi:hypothetical protein